MNLFCFTLEGSTESIYEPAFSQTLKEVLPRYQCSPALLMRKPEWGGSDPSINSGRPQNVIKLKRNSKRLPVSPLDNETLEKEINHTCWMSSGEKKDLSHQKKGQNRERCKAPCQSSMLTRGDRKKELNFNRTQTNLPAQGGETAADTTKLMQTTGRLKKFQNLVLAKKGYQNRDGRGKNTSDNNNVLAPELSNSSPVLTCTGFGKTTVKPSTTAPPPQQQQDKVNDNSDEVWSPALTGLLWSPFECPQAWTGFYHTCHQPRHELWVCGGPLSLPRTTDWDRFESLIQELDDKQANLSPPQMIHSITDLHLSQNTLTRLRRFDAFRHHSPLLKPLDNGSFLQEPNGDPTKLKLPGKQMEVASPSDTKHIINGNTQKSDTLKRETGGGQLFTKGHRQSSNSLESLYSLNSGQSSSSGVTSGSGCSSNRGSLRLEDDLLYTRQFCGRARVHTDYVPSPYDTESLRLQVGDVIDIISKPPIGIWTGMLSGSIGTFKFIYVDVLREESSETHKETQFHRVRHTSTVQEVLKRLSLEEYNSSLHLSGYQTVDDLMRLRENHLTALNVTDPEHRHRLLAAVNSLQQIRYDNHLENEANQEAETPSENMKADMNRNSGCHVSSDSPNSRLEDAELLFPSEHPLAAETTVFQLF